MLVLDDLGDWRGLGTALHLVEAGHDVTILTSAPVVAGGLFHSAADVPLRQRYARAGGRSITGATILDWRPGSATIQPTLTGVTSEIEADTLVIAESPVAVTDLAAALARPAWPSTRWGTASRLGAQASRSTTPARWHASSDEYHGPIRQPTTMERPMTTTDVEHAAGGEVDRRARRSASLAAWSRCRT